MGIIDIVIIILLVLGILLGIKRGFTKQLVCSLGTILSIILAFILKNKISVLLYLNLPFFEFGGILKGVTVLNILLYELIAFLVVFIVCSIIFKLLSLLTTLLESILTASLVFGIPSKILGAILGFIESYILIFVLLFVFTLPLFNFNDYIIKNSKLSNGILNNTPIVSNYTDSTVEIVNEFKNLKDEFKTTKSPMEFNRKTLNLFLKYKIITVESVETLVKKDKLKIDAIEEILRCYREETKNECNI